MYLLYLDDSGSTNDPSQNYLVLGGVCIFERQVSYVVRQLDTLASSINPSNPNSVEFHASEIYSGRSAPWKGMTRPQRIEVIRKVLSIVAASHPSVQALACAVHKDSFKGIDPMEQAFEDICSRFDIYLKRTQSGRDPQRGIIVLDESSHETTLQAMARDFRSKGTKWGVIKNIVEVPLFVDSQASRMIQLADHVAYAVFRNYQAESSSLLNIIIKRFMEEDGKLHGLLHRQTYDLDCMCPSCMSRRLTKDRPDPPSTVE